MNKRILIAATLAFAISVIGVNTNYTYADAECVANTYAELKACVESAPANTPTAITISSDFSFNDQLTISTNQDVTINGNNHTVSQASGYNGSFIYGNNANNANLSIKNLNLKGASSGWSAKWDSCPIDWGDDNLSIPCVDATEFSDATGRIDDDLISVNGVGASVTLEALKVESFAVYSFIGGYIKTASIINSNFMNNYTQYDAFDIDVYYSDTEESSFTFSNNRLSNNLFKGTALNIDSEWHHAETRNNTISNNWINDGNNTASIVRFARMSSQDLELVGMNIVNNKGMAALMLIDGTCGEERCSTINMSDSIISGNETLSYLTLVGLGDGEMTLQNVEISNNILKLGDAYGGTALSLSANESTRGVRLLNTRIVNNKIDSGVFADVYIAEGMMSAVPPGAGLTVMTTNEDAHVTVSVDDATLIAGNSASKLGFGDDLAVMVSQGKISDHVTLVGFENIASWYVDNADDRYNPASPIAFTDFTRLNRHNFIWELDGDDYMALGLKAVLPEDNSEKNPNTVDSSFLITIVISTISIITLAGIGLKTKARR